MLKEISSCCDGIRCLMYSMFDSAGYAMEAMEKGALGYVTKAADDSELLLAIEEVSRGKVYIQQSVVRGITVTSNQLVVM